MKSIQTKKEFKILQNLIMINDIWYHIFSFITDHKDNFNIGSVDRNFYQLINKRFIEFPWYKIHKYLQSTESISSNELGDMIQSYVSPRLGAKFQIYQRKQHYYYYYLLITDYTGATNESLLGKWDRNEVFVFLECPPYNLIRIRLKNSKTSYSYIIFMDNERFIDRTSLQYSYELRNSASLVNFDINPDQKRIIKCCQIHRDKSKIEIICEMYREIHHWELNIIKLYAKKPGDPFSSLIPCIYHSIPLIKHRLFVVQIRKTVYVISVKILKVSKDDTNVSINIIFQRKDTYYSTSQYLLNYDHETLTIYKECNNGHFKIIHEQQFEDSQSEHNK